MGQQKDDREDIAKKLYLHANEIIDCLMLDEFFENFMEVNVKYNE